MKGSFNQKLFEKGLFDEYTKYFTVEKVNLVWKEGEQKTRFTQVMYDELCGFFCLCLSGRAQQKFLVKDEVLSFITWWTFLMIEKILALFKFFNNITVFLFLLFCLLSYVPFLIAKVKLFNYDYRHKTRMENFIF